MNPPPKYFKSKQFLGEIQDETFQKFEPARARELKKRLSRRQLLLGSLGAVPLFTALEGLTEPNRIESVVQTVEIPNLPASLNGFRIGVISDIHWPFSIDGEFMKNACQSLMDLKPDLIAVTGDFFHGKDPSGSRPTFKNVLDGLEARFGVIGVLGNHDHWIGKSHCIQQIQDHSPVKLIDNKGFIIERSDGALAIGGIGDLWEDELRLDLAFRGVDPSVPRILLSHNPDTAQAMEDHETRVDLQISGHTHGGQVCIPGVLDFAPRASAYGSKFNRGLVEGGRHRVFVSKGIGRPHGIRFGARPDVCCLKLITA